MYKLIYKSIYKPLILNKCKRGFAHYSSVSVVDFEEVNVGFFL